MRFDIIGYSILGLFVSGVWVAIIWAIGKYQPSPLWGFLCFPAFFLIPLLGWLGNWLERRMQKDENQPEDIIVEKLLKG